MFHIFIFISIIYTLAIALLIFGFDALKLESDNHLIPKTTFSIIVPFRNEENNLSLLLQSFSALNYPKNQYEIVAINDDSEDESVSIFKKWQSEHIEISSRLLENIRKSGSPKKDAILTAIHQINNNWIITTDADCVVQKNWLLAFDNLIQKSEFEMLAGAVGISSTLCERKGDNNKFSLAYYFRSFLNFFQIVDLLSLQGTTIGSFGVNKAFMCNGANFAYTKNLFLALNGFQGNDNMSSGDDVFLLQKAVKYFPEKVSYLKNNAAIVYTKPEESWSKFFQQRVRWASKTGSYDGFFGKFLAMIVLAANLNLIFAFLILPFIFFFFLFTLKFLVDIILINQTNRFIGNQKIMLPIMSSLFYPLFCVSVAFYSFFGNFEWKKRTFKT